MICPYCTQWNPSGDRRCCFCNNQMGEGGEDVSVKAKPKYAMRAAKLLEALPSSYDLPAARRPRPAIKINLSSNMVTWIGGILLGLILLALISC